MAMVMEETTRLLATTRNHHHHRPRRRQLQHTIEFEIIVYPVQVISPLDVLVLVYQLIDGSAILAILKQKEQQQRSYAVMLCSTTSASDFIQQQENMHYTHIILQKDQLASQ